MPNEEPMYNIDLVAFFFSFSSGVLCCRWTCTKLASTICPSFKMTQFVYKLLIKFFYGKSVIISVKKNTFHMSVYMSGYLCIFAYHFKQ